MIQLFKSFAICVLLNLISLFVLQSLVPSAAEMNMGGLALTYLVFGVLLMVSSDIMFIKALINCFKGNK